jgi:hypothetical protein
MCAALAGLASNLTEKIEIVLPIVLFRDAAPKSGNELTGGWL